jgi:hypothetical protein
MTLPEDWLDKLRAEYPIRHGAKGWPEVKRKNMIAARLREKDLDGNPVTWEMILEGTKAYAKYCAHEGIEGSGLVKMAQTFYGPGQWFLEDYALPETKVRYRRPETVSEDQRQADILAFESDPLIRQARK